MRTFITALIILSCATLNLAADDGHASSRLTAAGLSAEEQKAQFYERTGLGPDDVDWEVRTSAVDGHATEVLIPVPIAREPRAPRYYKYRNGFLTHIPADVIAERTRSHVDEVRNSTSTIQDFMTNLQDPPLHVGAYEVDLAYSLVGQFGVRLIDESESCQIIDDEASASTECYQSILKTCLEDDVQLVILSRSADGLPAMAANLLKEWDVDHEIHYVPEDALIRFSFRDARVRGPDR